MSHITTSKRSCCPAMVLLSGFASLLMLASLCTAAELPSEALGRLKDDKFKVREAAQAEVLEWARAHEEKSPGLLFQYHRKAEDPEVRSRCLKVLESLARDGYAEHGKGFIGIQMRDELVLIPGDDKQHAAIRITFILPGLAVALVAGTST